MTTAKALQGVRVIEVANFLAAPSMGMHLADYGADVVKVERPGSGDEFRKWGLGKNGVALYFKVINRNKRSVTADLRTPLGQDIVKRLARTADILVENYRPGTMEKWGLGYDVLSAVNPGLVMMRLTGYGQTGPAAHKPGFGTALEGFAGAVYISGEPERPPLLPGFGLADGSAGIMGAFLALAALRERDANGGRGQVVDLALYEAMFGLLGPFVIDHDQHGIVQERMGSRVPWVAPRNTYRTRDGRWVSLSASSNQTFARLCRALAIPELAADPRFAENRDRIANAEALDRLLQDAIGRFDRDALIATLEAAEAVVAPVNSIADIAADPHIQARESIVAVDDKELGGPVRMQNVAGRFSRTPGRIAHAGPPLGAHNRQVLIEELGFSAEELAAAGLPT
ncbi:CaiB/BaiF CoA-transferase family protein [Vineibacter terrae]|uniref:CaiB/BaiF CoA transferase family protein n=1 Tax=Vineibacter terrae TaxID=2586908 RepID=UPI002E368CAF|nr:CaiB/BaiF CoA-transferase family protein [Vineibacter terrae]HEX2886306.1 CaiB/BaiF CoA-transferase family protein [Vineibacter terrae]